MSQDKMSTDRQEIAKKIRDGSYFSDALSWYSTKYLYPITDRSIAFVFATATLIALVPMLFLLNSTVESTESVPFPIYVSDSTSHASVISPLAQKDETAQEAIAKYLISDYIKSREEYIAATMSSDKLRKLFKKLKSSSTKQIFNEYAAYISENNVSSPLIIYKDGTNRNINIKSLSFLDNDKASGKAKVIFDAIEEQKGEVTKTVSWEALINFKLPDVETIAKTGAPLRFVVSYYRTKPLGEVKNIEPKNNQQSKPDKANNR